MKTYILLENVMFHAKHGVLEQENQTGNTFIVNLKFAYDFSKATESDKLEDTLSYADVYEIVKHEMGITSKLLEHVGGRIIRNLRSKHPSIETIELKISKQAPPIPGQIECASIIIID